MKQRIAAASSEAAQLIERFCQQQGESLALLARQIGELFAAGGQLLIAGQGPLQPLAQLLASHFTYRLGFDRPVLPAVALGSDPVLTAAMNSGEQSEQVLIRHYRALCNRRQLLLLLSDGHARQSLQLLRDEVLEDGQPVVLLTPDRRNDPLYSENLETCLSLKSDSAARLLELNLFAVDLLCELVEAELFTI